MGEDVKPKITSTGNAVAGPSRLAIPSTSKALAKPAPSPVDIKPSIEPVTKRPRAALPPIKKRDPAESGNPAAPSPSTPTAPPQLSLLAAAMARARQAQPAAGTAGIAEAAPPESRPDAKVKLNKKGHHVRFSDTVPQARPLVEERRFTQDPWEQEPAPWQVNGVGPCSIIRMGNQLIITGWIGGSHIRCGHDAE